MGNIVYDDEKRNIKIGIVEEFGEVQFEVLSKIKEAAESFKKNNIRQILDLGCGTGKHSIYLASKGFEVCAGDISKENIEITKSKAQRAGLEKVIYKELDMRKLPFNDNSFDAVICVSTISHGTYEDIKKTISEICRVLKPKGILVTDILSVNDDSYGLGQQLEENTFVGSREGEDGIPHHYASKKELSILFESFSSTKVYEVKYCYILKNNKIYISNAFDIVAEK